MSKVTREAEVGPRSGAGGTAPEAQCRPPSTTRSLVPLGAGCLPHRPALTFPSGPAGNLGASSPPTPRLFPGAPRTRRGHVQPCPGGPHPPGSPPSRGSGPASSHFRSGVEGCQ